MIYLLWLKSSPARAPASTRVTPSSVNSKSRNRLTGLLGLLIAILTTGCNAEQRIENPASAPPGGLAPYLLSPNTQDIVGKLGGVPVRIPRAYVRLVEYEGDPHWLEKRQGPPPTRTFESELNSFGILVHMPTMKPLGEDNQAAYEKRGFYDLEWIRTGVAAGSTLSKPERSADDPYQWYVPKLLNHDPLYDYEPLADNYGLKGWRAVSQRATAYRPALILDESNRGHSMKNHHIYLAYYGNRITSYIRCSSGFASAPGGRKTCYHRFFLLPEMRTEIDISYSPDSLANWREYESKMRELVLSWRVPAQAAMSEPVSSLSPSSSSPR